jgi:hypothetical protein
VTAYDSKDPSSCCVNVEFGQFLAVVVDQLFIPTVLDKLFSAAGIDQVFLAAGLSFLSAIRYLLDDRLRYRANGKI